MQLPQVRPRAVLQDGQHGHRIGAPSVRIRYLVTPVTPWSTVDTEFARLRMANFHPRVDALDLFLRAVTRGAQQPEVEERGLRRDP